MKNLRTPEMTKNCDISNFQAFPIPDLQKVGFVEYYFFFLALRAPQVYIYIYILTYYIYTTHVTEYINIPHIFIYLLIYFSICFYIIICIYIYTERNITWGPLVSYTLFYHSLH